MRTLVLGLSEPAKSIRLIVPLHSSAFSSEQQENTEIRMSYISQLHEKNVRFK